MFKQINTPKEPTPQWWWYPNPREEWGKECPGPSLALVAIMHPWPVLSKCCAIALRQATMRHAHVQRDNTGQETEERSLWLPELKNEEADAGCPPGKDET